MKQVKVEVERKDNTSELLIAFLNLDLNLNL